MLQLGQNVRWMYLYTDSKMYAQTEMCGFN